MRLKDHINENYNEVDYNSTAGLNDLIHRDCGQYLKMIRGLMPYYRGAKASNAKIATIVNVRKDRKPKLMPKDIAEFLNKWLEQNGHARRDKSVIATSNIKHTELFGYAYYMLPIDLIKRFTWVEAMDINWSGEPGNWNPMSIWQKHYEETQKQKDIPMMAGVTSATMKVKMNKDFEDYFHTNKGLRIAHDRGYETWFECDKYYLVSQMAYRWDKREQIFIEKRR